MNIVIIVHSDAGRRMLSAISEQIPKLVVIPFILNQEEQVEAIKNALAKLKLDGDQIDFVIIEAVENKHEQLIRKQFPNAQIVSL